MGSLYLTVATSLMIYLTPLYATDEKILNLEAEAFHSKMLAEVRITEPMILEGLHFIRDEEKINNRYKDPQKFSSLVQEIKNRDKNIHELKEFALTCQKIYEAQDDKRISLHVLLEKVKDIYFSHLAFLEKPRQLSTNSPSEFLKSFSQETLDNFFNPDKFFIR